MLARKVVFFFFFKDLVENCLHQNSRALDALQDLDKVTYMHDSWAYIDWDTCLLLSQLDIYLLKLWSVGCTQASAQVSEAESATYARHFLCSNAVDVATAAQHIYLG